LRHIFPRGLLPVNTYLHFFPQFLCIKKVLVLTLPNLIYFVQNNHFRFLFLGKISSFIDFFIPESNFFSNLYFSSIILNHCLSASYKFISIFFTKKSIVCVVLWENMETAFTFVPVNW